jgi:dTDP-4-amino-4,6-dideoxygalactose transaminase
MSLLDEKQIAWGIHYPNALPFIYPYSYKNHKPQDFKNSYQIVKEIISVPIYPEITRDQLNIICNQLIKY